MHDGIEGLKALRRLLLGVVRSFRRRTEPHAAELSAASVKPVRLGRTMVHLLIRGASRSPHVLVNVHENERTSVESALHVLRDLDGKLIALKAQGSRNVVFWTGWRPHVFDPNRIFSDGGIEATLRFHASDSEQARRALAGLRLAILAEIESAEPELVIALHNNGLGHYEIASFLPGAPREPEAACVHADAAADGGDFFLVTRLSAYQSLAGRGYGVVLLRPDAHDDGSMAHAFLHAAAASYVNVEARHGHRDQQCEMLRLALNVVQEPSRTGSNELQF